MCAVEHASGKLSVTDDKPNAALLAVCPRCTGKSLTLATFLPRMGDRPAYRIFTCSVCGLIEWIADQVKE
jgi:DNA-directed RNA polymerase subunit M/transcription elongation factor TFIIS